MSQALAEPVEPVPMIVDEFYEWADARDGLWQLVDGVPEAMAPPGTPHGAVQAELAKLLGNHLDATRPECFVLIGPGVTPQVSAAENLRVPDLVVTCSPLDEDVRTCQCPVLVIDILSPGNRAQTWRNVWTFTTIPSVQEIVVLHTSVVRASVLVRGFDGGWPANPAVVEGDKPLRLASVDMEIALPVLYRRTLLAMEGY